MTLKINLLVTYECRIPVCMGTIKFGLKVKCPQKMNSDKSGLITISVSCGGVCRVCGRGWGWGLGFG